MNTPDKIAVRAMKRVGHHGFWSAQRFFSSEGDTVIEVLQQEDDPPPDPAAGDGHINRRQIGQRSYRQITTDSFLTVTGVGEIAAPPADEARAQITQLEQRNAELEQQIAELRAGSAAPAKPEKKK